MKNKNNNIFIDVDETLIRQVSANETPDLVFRCQSETHKRIVNKTLVDQINNSYQDKFIVVWTSNCYGVEWAEEVVRLLNLKVDLVLAKPMKTVDDFDPKEWYFGWTSPPSF